MAFYGCEFIFDGVPCSEYGLMVYSFGSNTQSDTKFQSGEIIEDRIAGRYDALTYGMKQNGSLEFTLVFGANTESIDRNMHIERYEIEVISSWLTGHQQRKWLSIMQDDMHEYRYKCFITDLKLITHGLEPWAFSCTVSCDSPFAYTYPETHTFQSDGVAVYDIFNRSTRNGFYMPKMVIQPDPSGDTTDLTIQVYDSGNKLVGPEFKMSGISSTVHGSISVDNHNQIITSSKGVNMYPYFNMHFLRLARGTNHLSVTGRATVTIECMYPVDIGG